jgi:hypothetical protein
MFVISECFPSVVHSFPLGSGDVHQLDHCSFLHVLCLLVLVYEAGEGLAENSVDEIAESFFETVGFIVILLVLSWRQSSDLPECYHHHSCLRLQQSPQEVPLHIHDLPVGSELGNGVSQLLLFAAMEQVGQQFQHVFLLFLADALPQVLDSAQLSPSRERVIHSFLEHCHYFQ